MSDQKDDERLRHVATARGLTPHPDYINSSALQPKGPDGQHGDHWVLPDEERAKGFIRPVRQTYTHVGIRPKYPLRDLTEEEKERHESAFGSSGYSKYESYPEQGPGSIVGRFWSEKDLKSGCGQSTTMGISIAETYARNPGYYSSTFCVHCRDYFPVGEHGEFVWEGTNERVGT